MLYHVRANKNMFLRVLTCSNVFYHVLTCCNIRVDHISKSVSNVDSKLFIPFQYIRIYTKKIFSHIGTDLGVPQGGSNFTKGLIRENMSKTRKWPYLAWFSSKLKNKTTFFSSTLKVWQNKVVLFFHFKPKWAR